MCGLKKLVQKTGNHNVIKLNKNNLYNINNEKFVVISAGTGTGCVFYDEKNKLFLAYNNYLFYLNLVVY